MSKQPETLLVAKQCPICSNEVKDIAINHVEMLEMCTNTKCIYPFSKTGNMSIKRIEAGNETLLTTASTDCQLDSIDLEQFLNELTSTTTQELTKDVSDIISDLINSSPMFQDKG